MTRAVHFDGSTRLHNDRLGYLSDFARPFSCGLISYWYRSFVPRDATVLTAHSDVWGGVLQVGHAFNEENGFVFPYLRLAYAPMGGQTTRTLLLGEDPLPYDGSWHWVCYAWNTSVVPLQSKLLVDGDLNELTDERQADPDNPDLTIRLPFVIDYSIANDWRIGGRNPLPEAGPFIGDLAELYFRAMNVFVEPTSTIISQPANPFISNSIVIMGKGFFNRSARTFVAPNGTAMELGPLGLLSPGSVSLSIPQIYCHGDQSDFPKNLSDRATLKLTAFLREFTPLDGILAPASSDPFP